MSRAARTTSRTGSPVTTISRPPTALSSSRRQPSRKAIRGAPEGLMSASSRTYSASTCLLCFAASCSAAWSPSRRSRRNQSSTGASIVMAHNAKRPAVRLHSGAFNGSEEAQRSDIGT